MTNIKDPMDAAMEEVFKEYEPKLKAAFSQQSLEECLERVLGFEQETGERISARPTKIIVPRYPDETDVEFKARVDVLKRLASTGDLGRFRHG